MTKHIGIVAVSAEGAALCYRTICAEAPAIMGAHAHPQITMHTHPLSEYVPLLEEGDWDGAAKLLSSSAEKAVGAGAELLICPDNTLHQALDLFRDGSSARWLHIAEEVAAVASSCGSTRLGILGTRDLMEGPVYPSKLDPVGIEHVFPDAEDRHRVDRVIYDELVYGRFEDSSRQEYQEIIRSFGERGCDAVVLGCTEIPLLISEDDSSLPILDSTRILARAALREATGEKP